jgi:pullulanase/glycogen debranching enzyme
MYGTFGFSRWPTGEYGFQLFVPDNTIDPKQYSQGGPCRIVSVGVVGDFQQAAGLAANWDSGAPLMMSRLTNEHGFLFKAALPAGVPDGYYQYKYLVTFENGTVRWVGDPCTKYGGDNSDNSAFIIGGSPINVTPLDPAKRVGGEDLVVYELMIDDFTKNYRTANQAPVEAIASKLNYIKGLGANAIEFMPWVAWPDSDAYSWGYDPAYFFSAEYFYVTDPAATAPLEKLSRLGDMISACHQAGMMVLLDIVLQHASQGVDTRGFPYYFLWQDPSQCPFIGNFTSAGTFGSLPLQYLNPCTLQFITDVCTYWIDQFKVDGFRFDQVSGYENPSLPTEGAPALIANLKSYLATKNNPIFPLILEDVFDFGVVNDTNTIGATHGWFDMFRWYPAGTDPDGQPAGYLAYGNQPAANYMRVLNSAYQFNFPIGAMNYLENHDHSSLAYNAGGRSLWYRTQPYLIALATSPGAVMIANGQEFGRITWMPEPQNDNNYPRSQQRINPRALDWSQSTDATGTQMAGVYQLLLGIRNAHPGLRSPNFYPNLYDQSQTGFETDGYGIDVARQVVIYHRWGNNPAGHIEHFLVALNCSWENQFTNIPFPINGTWTDLINGNTTVSVTNFWLSNYQVNSYRGCVFYLAE